jgi:HK97 family phage portal protein
MKIPILSRIWERRTGGSLNVDKAEDWERVTGRGKWGVKSGVNVTPDSALKASAVFACVRVLSYDVAKLPFLVYKRLKRGKDRATDNPCYKLLHVAPNPETNSFHWRATMMAHTLLYGTSYSEIEFDAKGTPIAFWLIPAWRCKPTRVKTQRDKNLLVYEIQLPSGETHYLPYWRMLRIAGLSTDGMEGLSVIRLAAESIGVSLAAQEFAARFFGEGMNIGGTAEHPGHLSEEAAKRLQASLEEKYAGLGKSHRILLFEEGMKFNKVGIPPEDAQFLESRQFQVTDIARMFGVPPHKIADLSRATFSNIEQQSIEYVTDTLMPWLVNWEQEINNKLLDGGNDNFAEFLVEGLLRGDSQARSAYYNQMFMVGSLSPNEIREKENMNPVDGGDKYYIPLNMLPVGASGEQQFQEAKSREVRSRNYGILRNKMAKAHFPVFRDLAEKIVKQEKRNVLSAARDILGKRSLDSWVAWLEDYYREFGRDFILRVIKPAVDALSKAIQQLASDEVGATPVDIEEFIKKYIEAFVARYSKSSKGQLKQVAEDAIKNNQDPVEEIQQRLAEWIERRPDKVAMNETIQLSNAVARAVFAGAGIIYLVWTTTSGKSCPFCDEMNGKRVGVEQDFVPPDTVLEAGEKAKMHIYAPTSHPPLHEGCECVIVPG